MPLPLPGPCGGVHCPHACASLSQIATSVPIYCHSTLKVPSGLFVIFAKASAMGAHFDLTADDGHVFDVYAAVPPGESKGALVIIQEIFGVTQHIRDVADRYAAAGYLALAPGFYDRIKRGVEFGPAQPAEGRE